MNAKVYNQDGEVTGEVELPSDIFAVPWNADLVHQVATSMQANARTPVAHTKDRGEISGGGRKPWAQKGTGRARHGSIRSPLWRGGGVTFGPRNEKKYFKKINRKMGNKALYAVLSRKLDENRVLFVDAFNFNEPKTAYAKKVLENLSKSSGFEDIMSRRRNRALVALGGARNENTLKSFRNFNNLSLIEARDVNVLDTLKYKYIIITEPKAAIKVLSGRK